jgi:hypothetical protein
VTFDLAVAGSASLALSFYRANAARRLRPVPFEVAMPAKALRSVTWNVANPRL